MVCTVSRHKLTTHGCNMIWRLDLDFGCDGMGGNASGGNCGNDGSDAGGSDDGGGSSAKGNEKGKGKHKRRRAS